MIWVSSGDSALSLYCRMRAREGHWFLYFLNWDPAKPVSQFVGQFAGAEIHAL